MPTISWLAFTILEEKSSIASMNNSALWPYFPPFYLESGVECFYLVPPLFLAHTCKWLTSLKDTLVIRKCIWQFICNILQINSFLNSKFSSFSTWSWAWNALSIPSNFLALYMVLQIPLMLGNTHYQNKPSVLAVNRFSMRGSRYLMIEGDWNLTLIPNFPCVPINVRRGSEIGTYTM